MVNFYQHLPSYIDPVAFSIGSFEIRWYAVMYLVGFFVVYALLLFRIKKGEVNNLVISNFQFPISNKISNSEIRNFKTLALDLLLYISIGLLIGARIGYAVFYNPEYFLQNPVEIFLPIRVTGYGLQVAGISGMSYFGGLVGAILAGYIFTKKRQVHPVKSPQSGDGKAVFNRVNFLKLADFIIPAIPAGYFFGRLGNFLNGELYGRVTEQPWGMYFADGLLRHPSQLYEAFFEGLVIFAILWTFRNLNLPAGQAGTLDAQPDNQTKDIRCPNGSLLLLYLFLYGFFRFLIEFFREPDPQIGLIFNFLTLGQLFSLAVAFLAISAIFIKKPGSKSRA